MKATLKRALFLLLFILAAYTLQCTLFSRLALASVKPNLLIILTASTGFMKGSKEGMFAGLFAGIMADIQFGGVVGFYALLYLLIGYVNGLFSQMYSDKDIRLAIYLTAASETAYGLVVYVLRFVLRGRFDFLYYLSRVIIPELIYTVVVMLLLYPLLRRINRKLETDEKRSAGKFV